ncbi:MAG: fumarylacetoacetate hydrolase family protein [Armatimonadetes bacterium]|nr:fumarylacetoacetate hydrolase family protein [Armatimonadota bacterium]MCX7967121.1 fumarylacetoacetate hydrolase family protein [Armatimonadota bacterium]MDW8142702.1 fumarylacetoacetate hydrolase family protein [Armatimonadota bacterium]
MKLIQFFVPELGKRVGVVDGEKVVDITEFAPTTLALLERAIAKQRSLEEEAREALEEAKSRTPQTFDFPSLQNPPAPDNPHLLLPIDAAEIWGAGVTYKRSAEERDADSQTDIYTRVYFSDRPELFFKATLHRCALPFGEIAVRSDSDFTAVEAEVAVVVGLDNQPVAFTLCNDVSAWDIERLNPLYLPQSKIYAGCCAFGPMLVTPEQVGDPYAIVVKCRVIRNGEVIFEGEASTSQLSRRYDELISFLRRDNPVPIGTVLTTGTGIMPPPEAALVEGDIVEIESPQLGKLVNKVRKLEGN